MNEFENIYERSIEELKQQLKINKDITVDEWNIYANENTLFSAITLVAREDIKNWEELKVKYIKKPRNKVLSQIKKVRKKLDESVIKNGIHSDITRQYSNEIDALINEYYRSKEIRKYPETSEVPKKYQDSYNVLKKITKEFNEFPSTSAWNKYAQENGYMSNVSMQYVSGLDWNKIRDRICAEINTKI